jgi:kynurenine formamidase
MNKIPTDKEVVSMMESLSNWGQWGPDDQRGCLNYVTDAVTKNASKLIKTGTTVSCSRPITTESASDVTYQVQRFMVDSGEGRAHDDEERRINRKGAAEFIGMVFHGQSITHIDALSHYSWKGLMYNGVSSDMVTSKEGAQSHSIENISDGIITRGVLLDIAKLKNKSWLDNDEPVMPEDLDAAEKAQGITVGEGDVLFVRTGSYRKRLETGPTDPSKGMTACQVACTPWFKERRIAMLGTDTSNDIKPTDYPNLTTSPLHIMCLVTLGLWLVDNCNLEELSQMCEIQKTSEFLLAMGPLKLNKVTGSPVNPIAVF